MLTQSIEQPQQQKQRVTMDDALVPPTDHVMPRARPAYKMLPASDAAAAPNCRFLSPPPPLLLLLLLRQTARSCNESPRPAFLQDYLACTGAVNCTLLMPIDSAVVP